MNKEQLGKLLVELRKRKKINQKEMAERLGIVPSTLCKWEQGYTCPDITYFNKITDILDISYEELFHPEETLQKLLQSSTEKNICRRKKLNRKRGIICACVILLALLISYGVYQHKCQQFQLVTSRYNLDNESDIVYEMAIFYRENVSYDEWNDYENMLYDEWINGKYANNAHTVKLYFYSSKKDCRQWAKTDNITIFVK